MNYDKIKALEESILEALKRHDCDPKEASDFLNECFAERRIAVVKENQIKNLQAIVQSLNQKLADHKACISNLRGYIDFIESENKVLKYNLDGET